MARTPGSSGWSLGLIVFAIAWLIVAAGLWVLAFLVVPANIQPAMIGAASGTTVGGVGSLLTVTTSRRTLAIQQKQAQKSAYAGMAIAVSRYQTAVKMVDFYQGVADSSVRSEDDRAAAAEKLAELYEDCKAEKLALECAALNTRTFGAKNAVQLIDKLDSELRQGNDTLVLKADYAASFRRLIKQD